ncbi:MAG: class A beta-lactamase-related serine hydrolase [Clostridia bacterium]|nr:class A beta-lactamase-related serine hydrolase [Clostridia bacterium]
MKHRTNEYRMITIVLAVALAFALLVAGLFAALYLKSAEQTAPVGTGSSDEDLLVEIARLKNENEYLSSKVDALTPKTEAPVITDPVTEAPAETEERTPETAAPITGNYDPGDLTPADPESLSYTFALRELLKLTGALDGKVEDCPFIVDPEGKLMLLSDVEFDEDTEILYRPIEGTAYDRDGEPLCREIDYEAMGYTRPTAAVSYRDLERGTAFAANGDAMFFSASLIKAPYIYTLLEQIAKYNEIKAANPTNDPAVGKTLPEDIWEKYDLARTIRITPSMVEEGSGTIRDMDLSGGKDFTVLELIDYAIRVSDNTAFRILRNEFGYDYFWSVSRTLGVKSVFTSFNNLTAEEGVLYLSAIYDFAKNYPYEGGILISLMRQANHAVLIPYALNGKNVAHKYGWDHDSYHDMALVYGDAPYAVCIMTNFNFDRQSDDINNYIRSIAKAVDALHASFYADENIPK